MVRQRLRLDYPDQNQPATKLLELAHTVCIMHGLLVLTIRQHGQVIESIPKSLRAGYLFSGAVWPVVQVSIIYCPRLLIISTRTDLLRPFLQLESQNALLNHIWRYFTGF
jgi:hypothetical protein